MKTLHSHPTIVVTDRRWRAAAACALAAAAIVGTACHGVEPSSAEEITTEAPSIALPASDREPAPLQGSLSVAPSDVLAQVDPSASDQASQDQPPAASDAQSQTAPVDATGMGEALQEALNQVAATQPSDPSTPQTIDSSTVDLSTIDFSALQQMQDMMNQMSITGGTPVPSPTPAP